ncbi:MAG: hypothetical protein U0325_36030 [Polyangiales bacterium]
MPPRITTDADDLLHLRTAWHPLLILLLEHLLPSDLWEVLAEYPLTREPRRIDAVIVRRLAARTWRASHLHSVLDALHDHNLLHFKGATDALERTDALQVLSYAYQYMALRDLRTPAVVSLRVVAPTLHAALSRAAHGARRRARRVGGARRARRSPAGLRAARGGDERGVVHPGERLLYAISPACLTEPERPRGFDEHRAGHCRLLQGIHHSSAGTRWKAIMKDATLVGETASQALMDLLAIAPAVRLAGVSPEDLAVLPPEQRLAGLAPEQRLAGLAPEQRLAGLSEADRVLALPDAALRALPADYLATLPADAQARIRARLGR